MIAAKELLGYALPECAGAGLQMALFLGEGSILIHGSPEMLTSLARVILLALNPRGKPGQEEYIEGAADVKMGLKLKEVCQTRRLSYSTYHQWSRRMEDIAIKLDPDARVICRLATAGARS